MASKPTYDSEIAFQSDRRKAAVELIKIISDLWYDFSIELVLFRNQLMDRNVSEILKLHEYAGEFVNKPISIFDSVEMAQAIKLLNLPASKLDIGKLTFEYHKEAPNHSISAFLSKKLKAAKQQPKLKPKRCGTLWIWTYWALGSTRTDGEIWKRQSITTSSHRNPR